MESLIEQGFFSLRRTRFQGEFIAVYSFPTGRCKRLSWISLGGLQEHGRRQQAQAEHREFQQDHEQKKINLQ